MKSYETALDNELTREVLTQDEDFLLDASNYVYKRTGEGLTDPNQIYDAFMERMRYHEVNELDTISDLMYAQEADDEDKEEMARLFETFDRMDTDFSDEFLQKVADYGWGIVTAPSTYLGAATGGSAKVAAVAGQKATQALVRRALSGALVGASVEGAIGAGQNVAQQSTRMELDPEREFSGTELAVTAGLSAIPGAVTGFLGQRKRNSLAIKAERLERESAEAIAEAEAKASENLQKALSQDKAGIDAVAKELKEEGLEEGVIVDIQTLRPIDPELVAEGYGLTNPQELVEQGLAKNITKEEIQRISVAAKEMAEKGGLKRLPQQRISMAIVTAMKNKELPPEVMEPILEKYNLSFDEFSAAYAFRVSEAGSILQFQGSVGKSWDSYTKSLNAQKTKKKGVQPADPDTLLQKLFNIPNQVERVRRSILTSQPVTTVRNFVGGGARITVDAFEELIQGVTVGMHNAVAKSLGKQTIEQPSVIGSLDTLKYIWNDEEARMIADLYRNVDKKGYANLFAGFIDAAEASNNAAVGNGWDRVGGFFNYFNRMSDNFYKKAIFAGELSRITRTRMGKNLTDVIRDGEFKKIGKESIQEAVEKSFEMVYQQTPKGDDIFSKLGRGYLGLDKRAGFFFGAFIPFPRFVINQIKFMYDHAPVLGMIPTDISREGLSNYNFYKRFSKQTTGLGLMGMAYAMRDAIGPETEWYEYRKENGDLVDLRPFLGPLNLQLYLADQLYRSGLIDGVEKPQKSLGGVTKEIIQTAVGSSFRAGTGLFVVDRALPEFFGAFDGEMPTIKGQEALGRILGDYAATYTYQWPIALARDFYSLTDEELRLIPETKEGLDYLEIAAIRARRNLGPLSDFLPTMSEEFMQSDIPYIPDVTIKNVFPFWNVDRPQARYDIFTTEPLRKVDPIRTMTTGLNITKQANEFIEERKRLQLDPFEIYRPHPFPPADRYIRKTLSMLLPPRMEAIIRSEKYQRLSDEEKRVTFIREAKDLMTEIREKKEIDQSIGAQIQQGMIEGTTIEDHLRWQYESLPKYVRKAVESDNRLGPVPIDNPDYTKYLEDAALVRKSLFKAEGGLIESPSDDNVVESIIKPEEQIEDETTRQMVGLGLDLAPVTGEIRSAQAAVEDFEKGDYGMAALGAIGALPIIGIPGRIAKKAITKAINVRKDKKADVDYAELIVSGDKKFETRDTDSLRPYVGQRIGIAKTGDGEAKAIGSVEIGEPIEVDEKMFRELQDQHLVPAGTDFDIKPGGKKYLYPVSNPERFDTPKSVGRGIVARKILDDADEARSMLGDEDAIQAWKDANRLPESQRQKRTPIVQQAAQDLKEGKITGKEYRKVAKAEMPMRPITRENFPKMPTLTQIVGALTKDKSEKGIVGLNLDIPDGTRIGSRLDIPAYDNYDTWVVSLHDGTVRNGKAVGYGQTAVLDNVEFFTEGQGALNIATKKPKATIARIHGDYINKDPEEVYQQVYDLMDNPEWTQVGMNPFRHSFFYDKATGKPVTRADQVLQVGPLVLAKGARSELSDLKKLKIKSEDGKVRVFNQGGLMSRK